MEKCKHCGADFDSGNGRFVHPCGQTLPLPERLCEILKDKIEESSDEPFVLPDSRGKYE